MKYFILIILIGILISCGNSTKKGNTDKLVQVLSNPISIEQKEQTEEYIEANKQIHDLDYLKINGDSIKIPFFEIEIELTETAEKKLMVNNESIIAVAYFTSDFDDIDNIPEEYNDRLVRYTLKILTHTIELTDTRLARFENLEFPKKLYDLLENKDIDVLINIYSGRRSTDVNMLDCAVLSGTLSKIKEKRFTLNGGLTGERIKTNHIIFK